MKGVGSFNPNSNSNLFVGRSRGTLYGYGINASINENAKALMQLLCLFVRD
jgi:hypothetical protein